MRTGKGTASSYNRYYNFTWYVWNNGGDTAYLKNASGTLVHKCTWTSAGQLEVLLSTARRRQGSEKPGVMAPDRRRARALLYGPAATAVG